MTATSVASSGQMASASIFGQPSQSKSPAFNPFASNSPTASGGGLSFGDSAKSKKNKRNGNTSDSEGKRPFNPFKDATLSDGGKPKNQSGEERKKKGPNMRKNHANGDASKKLKAQSSRDGKSSNPFATKRSQSPESRPSSSSSNESPQFQTPAINTNDPHARKVYEQLRKDGISPPAWPSQPGNPSNKAQMSKFRDKYEAYRNKVRASLTRAGLIDDPEKRKTLQDAIDFKGICEDMCPEYEKITRITEVDVHQPEKNPRTAFANTRRMVKKLARSAAGQEAPLPMDVRSIPALKRTLDYLIDDLLQHDGNLATLHGFLWDRTRAIRRDFTFFSSLTPEEMKIQVNVLEDITRFHVTALHLLSQEGKAGEDFVEQQELEQLGKTLLSLRDCYDDCNEQGITCENEAEFRAYYLVFHAFDSNIIETLQRQWRPNLWKGSDEIRTAVSLVEALQNTQDFHGPLKDAPSLAASAAYHSYFRIVESPDVSYTMACFAECHFPHIRRTILVAIKKALARPRETTKDVTAAVLNKFLRFDTVEEAIQFAELHDFQFASSEENTTDPRSKYLVLDNRNRLPHHRLQHHFSQSLVEKKRGSRPLPDLMHESVREDLNAPKPTVNGPTEESLFVSESESSPTQPSFPTGPKAITPASPLSHFSHLSGDSSGSLNSGTTPAGSSSSPSISQPTTASNPFAPTSSSTIEDQPQFANPFSSPETPNPPSFFTPGVAPLVPPVISKPSAGGPVTNPFLVPPSSGPSESSSSAETPSSSAKETEAEEQKPLNAAAASPFQAPKMGFNFLKPPSGKDNEVPKAPEAPSTSAASLDLPKASPANIASPAPKFTPPKFGIPPITPATSSTPGITPSQPSSSPAFKFPIPPPVAKEKTTPPNKTSPQPAPAISKSNLAPQAEHTAKAASSPSILEAPKEISTKPAELPKSPIPPPEPPGPPRDLLGDFNKWFVEGDNGLLEEFQAYMLDDLLQKVFTTYTKQEAEKRRQQEEERAIAEADAFRVYNLSVKYFYRWRDIARHLRLSALRRSGRAQVRSYYEARREADRQARKQAARRAAREKAEMELLNRPEELKHFMQRKVNERQAEDDLLASGVLSGLDDEQAAVARIVRKAPSSAGSVTTTQSRMSQSTNVGGPKTQALRERLLRDRSTSFRRSLPPMSSRESLSPSSGSRSRASERWRLKAMGIVQMPDGTALPESLANEIKYGKKTYPGIGSMGPPPNGVTSRRASIDEPAPPRRDRTYSASEANVEATTKNKRKRPAEDEGDTSTAKVNSHSHKRVMSDAANLINELRAMREEMEEGATWFKEQNERLQSELASRGSTPWDHDT